MDRHLRRLAIASVVAIISNMFAAQYTTLAAEKQTCDVPPPHCQVQSDCSTYTCNACMPNPIGGPMCVTP